MAAMVLDFKRMGLPTDRCLLRTDMVGHRSKFHYIYSRGLVYLPRTSRAQPLSQSRHRDGTGDFLVHGFRQSHGANRDHGRIVNGEGQTRELEHSPA